MSSNVVIFLMPHKIQKRRYDDMIKAAKTKKFNIYNRFRPEVTHVVTEFETYEQAERHLNITSENGPEVLKVSWFTESIRARKPLQVTDQHRLPRSRTVTEPEEEPQMQEDRFPEWACQRSTPLRHHNEFLTSQLEILEKFSEMKDENSDYSRALAYRRAACVLKSLPFRVSSINQLRDVKDVGAHSKRVINEILEEGFSTEVDGIVRNEWFQKMKMFTKVFGIGPSTAKKWIERGWTTIKEAQNSPDISKDWRVQWGLACHDDLINPVGLQEADHFLNIVKMEAEKILPGVIVQLTGGFRRGKPQGHDIDILFSHPDEGKETGFLCKLLVRLEKLDLILCGSHESSSFHEKVLYEDYKLSARGQLDHFEKWLGICKLPKHLNKSSNSLRPVMNNPEIRHDIKNGNDSLEEYEPKAKKQKQCCEENSKFIVASSNSLDEYEPKAKKQRQCHDGEDSPFTVASSDRDWIARRVDLIMAPYSQYYYALVGWTGSRQFNRDLRLYSQKFLNSKLTSHGLYNFDTSTSIQASSEKEVFDNLNLPHLPPDQRNC